VLIRLRQVLLSICTLAIAWSAVVVLTGGFTFFIGSVRLSSRNPLNALLVALVAAAADALPLGDRWRGLSAEVARSLHPARLAAVMGVLLLIYGWAMARPLWLDEEMIALNIRERTLSDSPGDSGSARVRRSAGSRLSYAMPLTLGAARALRLVPALFGIATVIAALRMARGGWARSQPRCSCSSVRSTMDRVLLARTQALLGGRPGRCCPRRRVGVGGRGSSAPPAHARTRVVDGGSGRTMVGERRPVRHRHVLALIALLALDRGVRAQFRLPPLAVLVAAFAIHCSPPSDAQ
jgi:hypothetical protein